MGPLRGVPTATVLYLRPTCCYSSSKYVTAKRGVLDSQERKPHTHLPSTNFKHACDSGNDSSMHVCDAVIFMHILDAVIFMHIADAEISMHILDADIFIDILHAVISMHILDISMHILGGVMDRHIRRCNIHAYIRCCNIHAYGHVYFVVCPRTEYQGDK